LRIVLFANSDKKENKKKFVGQKANKSVSHIRGVRMKNITRLPSHLLLVVVSKEDEIHIFL